jgi:general secretion pathway protein E
VLGVMAQRLVRTLCPHCKGEEPVDPEAWQQLIAPYRAKMPDRLFAPRGCLECRDTGFLGRVGIYELMPMSDSVRNHVTETTELGAVRTEAMREGMRTLRLAGAQKVAAGLTTIAEVLRVAPIAHN